MQNSVKLRSSFFMFGIMLLLLTGLFCTPASRQVDQAILFELNKQSLNTFQLSGSIVAADTIPVPWPPPKKQAFYVIKNADLQIVDDDLDMIQDGKPVSLGDFSVTKTVGIVSPDNKLGGLLVLKLDPGEKIFVFKATPVAK